MKKAVFAFLLIFSTMVLGDCCNSYTKNLNELCSESQISSDCEDDCGDESCHCSNYCLENFIYRNYSISNFNDVLVGHTQFHPSLLPEELSVPFLIDQPPI